MSSVRTSYCSHNRYASATTARHASSGSLNLRIMSVTAWLVRNSHTPSDASTMNLSLGVNSYGSYDANGQSGERHVRLEGGGGRGGGTCPEQLRHSINANRLREVVADGPREGTARIGLTRCPQSGRVSAIVDLLS
eukprot:scaffold207658_cov30-Tisochrysis_lutea.AAC.3